MTHPDSQLGNGSAWHAETFTYTDEELWSRVEASVRRRDIVGAMADLQLLWDQD